MRHLLMRHAHHLCCHLRQETGSAYIGTRARKDYGARVSGTITKWLPPSDDDPAWWHVVYDNGEEEDFDLDELVAARALRRGRPRCA